MMSIEQVDVRIRFRETIKKAAVKGLSREQLSKIFKKELDAVLGEKS